MRVLRPSRLAAGLAAGLAGTAAAGAYDYATMHKLRKLRGWAAQDALLRYRNLLPAQKAFTPSELAQESAGGRIYVGLGSRVYDVSESENFQEGGLYAALAGCDATCALAQPLSFAPVEEAMAKAPQLAALTPEEQARVDDWRAYFDSKYLAVGSLAAEPEPAPDAMLEHGWSQDAVERLDFLRHVGGEECQVTVDPPGFWYSPAFMQAVAEFLRAGGHPVGPAPPASHADVVPKRLRRWCEAVDAGAARGLANERLWAENRGLEVCMDLCYWEEQEKPCWQQCVDGALARLGEAGEQLEEAKRSGGSDAAAWKMLDDEALFVQATRGEGQ